MEYKEGQRDSQGKVFSTMLVFESIDKCPKCKEDRFMVKDAKRVRKFFYKYHEAPVNANKCYKPNHKPDGTWAAVATENIPHMDITCSFCGYEWAEEVA